MFKKALLSIAVVALIGVQANRVEAASFSFTGTFTQDDNVQVFNFVVGAPSLVTLRTWSYAGGVNAAGAVIARGGFDPILALFNSAGALINQNDDGGPANVPADAVSGANWDTFLTANLAAGNYSVAVMQYDNFANGPNFANGFARQGQGNFTGAFATGCLGNGSFEDVSGGLPGCQRDNHWAFDILNVASADVVGPPTPGAVPEPASLILLGTGLVGAVIVRRKKNRQAR